MHFPDITESANMCHFTITLQTQTLIHSYTISQTYQPQDKTNDIIYVYGCESHSTDKLYEEYWPMSRNTALRAAHTPPTRTALRVDMHGG